MTTYRQWGLVWTGLRGALHKPSTSVTSEKGRLGLEVGGLKGLRFVDHPVERGI
jgi:hypothetical protein